MTKPKQIAFHVGVHTTDEERLFRSLRLNADVLREQKIELCDNQLNEPILNEAAQALRGGIASPEMEEVVIDALVEEDDTARLIISRPTLLGVPRRLFNVTSMMEYTGEKMIELTNIVPTVEAEFHIGIKNPVTLMARLINRASISYDMLMNGTDPLKKRWGPTMIDVVQKLRGRKLVVWCHEDMPMIFPEVLHRLSGVSAETTLKGGDRLLRDLLTPEGVKHLREEIADDMEITARRAAVEVLLEKYTRKDVMSMDIDCPGWTKDVVEQMTADYHEDIAMIAALPGVEFISP